MYLTIFSDVMILATRDLCANIKVCMLITLRFSDFAQTPNSHVKQGYSPLAQSRNQMKMERGLWFVDAVYDGEARVQRNATKLTRESYLELAWSS